jgi:N,N'-diacetyllegionaminate synthase
MNSIMEKRTLIIAEAGVNHNGDMELAKKLIDAAAQSGADMVKFQTFTAESLLTTTVEKADYQIRNTNNSESQHEMIRKLELSRSMHDELMVHCRSRNISFFSTAFDISSLNFLNELGLDRFKIPSGEITNLPYLRQIGSFGKPVLLSTGMATLGEIEAAIDVLEKSGIHRSIITVLHCCTDYPTPMEEVNLNAMLALSEAFGVKIGYSDHTDGIEVPIAAVALGATVIEKHLTIDRTLPGPDHMASIEPNDFAKMVRSIRNIELAMGDGIKRPKAGETKNKPIARKSLVAKVAIKAGELFTPENVTAKRPGTGISPMAWDHVMGRTALRDFSVDELIVI